MVHFTRVTIPTINLKITRKRYFRFVEFWLLSDLYQMDFKSLKTDVVSGLVLQQYFDHHLLQVLQFLQTRNNKMHML